MPSIRKNKITEEIFQSKTLKLPFVWKRSKRKSLGIYIVRGGVVEVRSSHYASLKGIHDFIDLNLAWILQKQIEQKKRIIYSTETLMFGKVPDIQFVQNGIDHYAEGTLYIKKTLKLKNIENDLTGLSGELLRKIFIQHKELHIAFQKARLAYAKKYLTERFMEISQSEKFKKFKTELKIRDMKARWGSCHYNGKIVLNERLIAVPAEAIDSVIMHELCHLYEYNHSPRFKKILTEVCPDWKKYNAMLLSYSTRE